MINDQLETGNWKLETHPGRPQPLAPSPKVPLVAFLGADLLGSPAERLLVALGTIFRELALEPRCGSPRDVLFDVVVERPGGNGYACVEYRGDAYELGPLARAVREVWAGKI
ncbi:MAG TPA: hypothetical protein VMH22_02815 [bacterium]|nr:hypothetical protein [bacterium]